MKIRTKVTIFFIIALFVSIIAAAFIFVTVVHTRAGISELELVSEMRTTMFNRANLFDEYLLYRTERSSQQWTLAGKQIDGLIQEAKKIFNAPDQSAILVSVEESNNTHMQTGIQIFSDSSMQQEMILSRKIEVSLIEKILIERNGMSLSISKLSEAARRDISISQKKLAISTGSAISLLLVIIFLNLTWLRKIITKLEESNVKYQALFESIGDGVIGTNLDGKIILINQSAQTMLGWHSENLVGRALLDVLPITDEKGNIIPDKEHPVRMTLITGIPTTTTTTGPTYNYVRKDKTKFPVANIVSPVVIDGKTVGAIEVFRDITKEKDIDKAKTEFVSLVSHQLRTPLSIVNWYTEMLLEGDAGDLNEKQKKYLHEVNRSNQRMIELVNALLNVASLELGTFITEPQNIDICDLVRSVVKEQEFQINARKMQFSFLCENSLLLVRADPKLLHMAIQNVLSNAVKYTPVGGQINVSLMIANKDRIKIKISDTGYGIPKNQQERIFTKLFRADNVREKDTDGTGLGLYIAKSIVENSGGTISFQSPDKNKKKGTSFYITLPLEITKRSTK